MIPPSPISQGGSAPDSFSALAVVLVLVTLGLLVLAIGRRISDLMQGHACHPRNSAGLESLRS
jgi:hypothetical protein